MARKAKGPKPQADKVGDKYKAPISPKEPATPPPPAGGPGSPMEIIFSFDTTGSMYSLLDEVRRNVADLIKRLQDDIPNMRIGVIAHGDYCDENTSYVVKMVDFTRDTEELINFVRNVGQTGGGDSDECYELALKTARTQFSWSPGTLRSLVMIGDADPHKPDYHVYKTSTPIDWQQEVKKLFAMGVHIYGVRCDRVIRPADGTIPDNFYTKLAQRTDGTYLELNEFKNIFDMICAICYKEHGAEYFFAYEQEVRDREKRMLNKDLDAMFVTLRKSASNASTMSLKDSSAPSTPPTTTTAKTALKRVAPTAVVAPSPAKKVRIAAPTPAKKVRIAAPTPAKKKKAAMKTTRKVTATSKKTVKKTLKWKTAKRKVVKKPGVKKMTGTKKVVKRKTTRMLREAKTSGANIKNCTWSHWELLFAPDYQPDGTADCPRRRGHVGYYNERALADGRSKPALYELAISTPGSAHKYVVYIRRCVNAKRKTLATHLFRYAPGLLDLIDDLMRKKCKVFVRRAVLSSSGTLQQRVTRTWFGISALRKQFDYAWCKNGYGRRNLRAVTKNGILISDSKY